MGFAAHQGLRRAEDTCPGGEAEAVVQKTRVQGRRGGRWCRKHMFTGEGGGGGGAGRQGGGGADGADKGAGHRSGPGGAKRTRGPLQCDAFPPPCAPAVPLLAWQPLELPPLQGFLVQDDVARRCGSL